MSKYVVYWVYKSKPNYLNTTIYTAWCSIRACMIFIKNKKPYMQYIGVAKLKKKKEGKKS